MVSTAWLCPHRDVFADRCCATVVACFVREGNSSWHGAGAVLTSSGTLCMLLRSLVLSSQPLHARQPAKDRSWRIGLRFRRIRNILPAKNRKPELYASHRGGATKLPRGSVPIARAPLRPTH